MPCGSQTRTTQALAGRSLSGGTKMVSMPVILPESDAAIAACHHAAAALQGTSTALEGRRASVAIGVVLAGASLCG
jgi:hypothetical protein